jgi:hypothetical protein
MEIRAYLPPPIPHGPPSSLVSSTRSALSTSEQKPLAAPAGVCGGPIAAMMRFDLLRLPNPAAPICVITAMGPEFDLWIFLNNLPARQQCPARGCHASA